jgi:hypothetical protein
MGVTATQQHRQQTNLSRVTSTFIRTSFRPSFVLLQIFPPPRRHLSPQNTIHYGTEYIRLLKQNHRKNTLSLFLVIRYFSLQRACFREMLVSLLPGM